MLSQNTSFPESSEFSDPDPEDNEAVCDVATLQLFLFSPVCKSRWSHMITWRFDHALGFWSLSAWKSQNDMIIGVTVGVQYLLELSLKNLREPSGTSEKLPEPQRTSRNLWQPSGTSENLCKPQWAFRNLWELSGTSDNLFGTSENTQEPQRAFRNLREPLGTLESIQEPQKTFRNEG